jgi:hypothetical protein
MQELAQLGGTGNKIMAYAVPSDVDLIIVSVGLVMGCSVSDDTQWPDLNEIRKGRKEVIKKP